MTNLFTLPWRKPFTIVFHSDAVWRWVTRACTTDREGFNRCARKLYKHTRPDNRVTFVIFHARRREQIRHDAIPPFFHDAHSLFFSFFLSFRAIKFLLACPWKQALARTIHKHTHARNVYDRRSIFLINVRFFPRLELLVFILCPPPCSSSSSIRARKILDPLNSRLVPRPCRDLHLTATRCPCMGVNTTRFCFPPCHTLMVINQVNRCS